VLDRVLEGKPNRQIAEELSISLKTVEFHRARIMQKLGVRTAAELFRRCLGSN
jgi:DNA-binding CsgD family transcriptional regulator